MASNFQNSMFYKLLMQNSVDTKISIMGGISGSRFLARQRFMEQEFVVFDFETTGLDVKTARIIEIGAIKYKNKKEINRFSQLINPKIKLSAEITKITGLSDAMLKDQPTIETILPKFHNFLRGTIGVAHNAEYDLGILTHESKRLGILCEYTIICTLRLARAFLKLESRSLDSLAKHYGLEFTERHRAIGDIEITAQVLWNIFAENPHLQSMAHLEPYREF